MLYLKNNKTIVGKLYAKHYPNMGQCQKRHDKMPSLQDDNFILPVLNPNAFLDILDNLVLDDFLCHDKDDKNLQG